MKFLIYVRNEIFPQNLQFDFCIMELNEFGHLAIYL